MFRRATAISFVLLAFALLGPLGAPPQALAVPPSAGPAASVPIRRADVIAFAERTADYHIAALASGVVPPKAVWETGDMKGWVQAAFMVGLTDLADRSERPLYRQVLVTRGEANGWQPDKRLYHADDQAIGQAYLWVAAREKRPDAIAPLRTNFDKILAKPSKVPLGFGTEAGVDCQTRWCWCDALFMAPPAWVELSNATGDPRYADFAIAEIRATTDYLYDKDEHLYYRDSRFFDRRGPNGEKVFWSRGNGWVFGGLARVLTHLPKDHPARPELEKTFRDMAAKLISIQKADGYWAPSLLADPAKAQPESSGTAFYVYGLAWGIKAGILDRKTYDGPVRSGWAALVRAVQPDGMLGHVQPIGDQPDNVSTGDTQYYGAGAFLMAASAIADLDLKK